MKRGPDWRKPAMQRKLFFLKQSCLKNEWRNFCALLTEEKWKMATNEWENDNFDILQALHSKYKKLG